MSSFLFFIKKLPFIYFFLDENAAMSAAWFYVSKGCLNYTGDVKTITIIINGGANGLDDRSKRFTKAKSVLV